MTRYGFLETVMYSTAWIVLTMSELSAKTSDLHIHLGGSVGRGLLEGWAREDGEQPVEPAVCFDWFGIVHKRMNSPERVQEATQTLIENSAAEYIEIRTTPRVFDSPESDNIGPYVEAFVAGLRRYPAKAKGILSVNRYRHGLDTVTKVLDEARKYPEEIVGIDISGFENSGRNRVLVDDQLRSACQMILESDLGLAVHMGEFKNDEEEADTDDVLGAIAEWLDEVDARRAAGKIRIGHCIHITEKQAERILKYALPVELCPTCHLTVEGWWKEGSPHPVLDTFASLEKGLPPIVLGTDDTLVFSTNFEKDLKLFNDLGLKIESAYDYRFGVRQE